MSDGLEKILFDPMKHPEWVVPHSPEWYKQLFGEVGEYKYPWKSTFDEPRAEMILAEKINSSLCEGRLLDVGCGHGEFAFQFALNAKEVVGIDVEKGFIEKGNKTKSVENINFLIIDGNGNLPFPNDYFDVAYTKKGPRDWYHEGNRIVRAGGTIIGFYHAGSHGALRELFPGLYSQIPKPEANDILRVLNLHGSGLTDINVELLEEIEYLSTPEDVLIKKCFGQSKKLRDIVWQECLQDVERIFNKYATSKGLKIINYYHLLTAKAS
ncbi:class I SAM-dependent methyltransferase [Paenibacillus sp. PFR10]|uniref:Class I SAM-dependent methyltransferase n=2 Tax=Paenibacillus TaxID=44249 RepID=A0ABU3RIL6_9BACL|nr:class I SAM-dependent methyltransferase [Paenibacillus sp. PFR10]MDU0203973.1 class I SAM-dependent methyltransferase [Paenibacillus sp. PFR10]